jgi:murein DD-endopeptidase MepM/ murein hydrolase activator NlpD
MFKKIFKNLDGSWKKINLNEEAIKFPETDLSDPKKCEEWLNDLHKDNEVDFSYGGFLEDRSFIWRDHYNVKKNVFIHEGVDFNVPLKTEVFLFADGEVVEIIRDTKMFGGWGNAVALWIPSIKKYVIYGHLDKKLFVSLGQKYRKGDKIGRIGGPNQNGHYFPHLHVQVMDRIFSKKYKRFFDVEGYSPRDSKMINHIYDIMEFLK